MAKRDLIRMLSDRLLAEQLLVAEQLKAIEERVRSRV